MLGQLRTGSADAVYMPIAVGLHTLVDHVNTNYSVSDQHDHLDDDLYNLDDSDPSFR